MYKLSVRSASTFPDLVPVTGCRRQPAPATFSFMYAGISFTVRGFAAILGIKLQIGLDALFRTSFLLTTFFVTFKKKAKYVIV